MGLVATVSETPLQTLSIETLRSTNETGPEGIFFTANPSLFTVDTAAIGSHYEPMRHELEFFWTITGADHSFTVVENVPSEWTDWNTNGGHVMSRVFLPGEWTVACLARHKRTGESATAQTTFTVKDPDEEYDAAHTAILAGSGDSFTGAPSHASGAEYTTLGAVQTWARSVGEPVQVYVRSDMDEQSGRMAITSADSDILFRVWDVDGGKPTIRPDSDLRHFEIFGTASCKVTLWGLNFAGNWDPDTETIGGSGDLNGALANSSDNGAQLVVYDCDFSGHNISLYLYQKPGMTILEDCRITNWQNFGILAEDGNEGGYLGISGTLMAQSSDAIMGGNRNGSAPFHNNHGPIRVSSMERCAMSCLDLFSGCGWTTVAVGDPPYRFIQPCIRMWTGLNLATESGYYGHLERLSMEGGGGMNIKPSNANDGAEMAVLNLTVDKALVVADPTSFQLAEIMHSGVTITNLAMSVGSVDVVNDGMNFFISCGPYASDSAAVLGGPEEVLDEPVRISGVSCYSLRDSDGDEAKDVDIVSSFGEFTNARIDGAIRHLPNRTGKSEDAPYVVTGIDSWFTARQTGFTRSGETKETVWATDSSELAIISPDTGSPALDSGELGPLPPSRDFYGNERGSPANEGAVG